MTINKIGFSDIYKEEDKPMKNSFKKSLAGVFCAAVLGLTAIPASAAFLSLQPTIQSAVPTDSISLSLVISGLNAGGPDSLGDFDIDIGFDSGALSFQGYSLGASLGDIGLFEALDFSLGNLGGGKINLAEVSLLEADAGSCIFCSGPYLDDIQSDSFILATLDFTVDVLAVGSSTAVFFDSVFALGDGFGNELSVSGLTNAVINNPMVSVPEPTTLALMALGIISVTRRRRLM